MIGKFASAEELLKGYNELEKSFTQKCQELAQLKAANAQAEQASGTNAEASPQEVVSTTTVEANTVPVESADASTVNVGAAATSTPPTDEQLQQYLQRNPAVAQRLLQQTPVTVPAVMSGGGNVSLVVPTKPKSLKEASMLVKELMKG